MNFAYKVRQELKPKGLAGISDKQLDQHWGLYEGYVKNVNLLREKLAALSAKSDFGPEFAELKRRLGFEYNGMVLHEHYFGCMKAGAKPLAEDGDLGRKIKDAFGSFAAFKAEFAAVGKMRGIGWAILYYDPRNDVVGTHWVSMHEEGHPAGFAPLLVMDVWEHAYMVDHPASGRPAYIEAFLNNVDWAKVELGLKPAVPA